MTIIESVIFRVCVFALAVTVFTACTTGGVASEGRRAPQSNFSNRP